MIDPGKVVATSNITESPAVQPAARLVRAAIFGLAFGFLLQKGGVGKYHVLVGQLLLQDFTVVKVMLTAIVVGMVGIFALHHFAKVNLHLKPTRIGPNIIGGLIFGAGFALIGYCPGTVAAALGQGNFDGLFAMAGLMLGSYVYALASRRLAGSVETWGDMGKMMLSDLGRVPRAVFIPVFAIFLAVVLVSLAQFTVR
jgi:uncharacterized membrane protein YedE/YeeE